MKNIHLIPTSKPSKLLYSGNNKNLLFSKEPISFRTFERSPQNIYITSDEEIIYKGDWMYYKHFGEDIVCKYDTMNGQNTNVNEHKPFYQKIILTTDPDLIKDGVQSIDKTFLEWFVKNPSCEFVKTDKVDTFKKTNEVYVDEITGGNYYEVNKQYKIIIPQEEPKFKNRQTGAAGFVANKIMENMISEFKQETLEEAAERLFKEFQIENPIVPNNHIGPFKLGFIKSAKWQQEQDKNKYSKEDMINFAEFVATYPDKNKNINGQILHAKSKYDGSERTVDLLEQFKKK